MFLRELVANHPDLRGPILQQLSDTISEVHQSRVLRGCLWLFGEFCESKDAWQFQGFLPLVVVSSTFQEIDNVHQVCCFYFHGERSQFSGACRKCCCRIAQCAQAPSTLSGGEATAKKEKEPSEKKEVEKKEPVPSKVTTKTVVLADGTYGTQTMYESKPEDAEPDTSEGKQDQKKSPMRNLLVGGDFLLSAMLGVSLTKLSLKCPDLSAETKNEVLFAVVNLFKISKQQASLGDKSDCSVRLTQCVRALLSASKNSMSDAHVAAAELIKTDWSSKRGRDQLAKVLEIASLNSEWNKDASEEVDDKTIAPDECIVFRQLRERKGLQGGIGDTFDDDDFKVARGMMAGAGDGAIFTERLSKVQQMTGLADPVYVEAFLQVHSFDLVLELLMINRTNDTLQNVVVVVEHPG